MTQHRTPTDHNTHRPAARRPVRTALIAFTAGCTLLLTACSGTASSSPPAGSATGAGTGPQVVPVASNPITNTSTATTLSIDKVTVENNTDAGGATVNDHLQFDVHNSGTSALSGFEVFYTFADPAAGTKESYYLKLPATFTVPANGSRTANFDNTGSPDHFEVNKFSLYYTSKAALNVTVEVSATGVAPATMTAKKDPGGSENAGG